MPTLDGHAHACKVPAGSSSGRRLRLRGQGMPGPRRQPGDLYAVVKIVVPKTARPTRSASCSSSSPQVSNFDPRRSAVTADARVAAVAARRSAAPRRVEIEVLAREAGLHPDLVRRLVRLGLLEPRPAARAGAAFPRDAAARLARAARLRRDLGLNYAGAVLACELLARIDELEERLRRYEPRPTARGDGMDPNRLTQKTQEALHDAQTKALRYGHTEVDVEHLLLALLEQPDGLVPRLLERWTCRRRRAARARSSSDLERRPRVSGPGATPGEVYVSRSARRSCSTRAEQEAERLKDEYVSVEHLLLAMLDDRLADRRRRGCSRSTASRASASSRR